MPASAPSSAALASFSSALATAITRAPKSLAIWTAAVPTPLPAPMTSTSSPRFTRACRTSMFHAVRKARGTAAGAGKAQPLRDRDAVDFRHTDEVGAAAVHAVASDDLVRAAEVVL